MDLYDFVREKTKKVGEEAFIIVKLLDAFVEESRSLAEFVAGTHRFICYCARYTEDGELVITREAFRTQTEMLEGLVPGKRLQNSLLKWKYFATNTIPSPVTWVYIDKLPSPLLACAAFKANIGLGELKDTETVQVG